VLSNGRGAACRLVVSSDGDHAYTANAATGALTGIGAYGLATGYAGLIAV
jgi:hypothetical protein